MTSTTPKTSMPILPGERESFWSSRVWDAVAMFSSVRRVIEVAAYAKGGNYTESLLRECEKRGFQFAALLQVEYPRYRAWNGHRSRRPIQLEVQLDHHRDGGDGLGEDDRGKSVGAAVGMELCGCR